MGNEVVNERVQDLVFFPLLRALVRCGLALHPSRPFLTMMCNSARTALHADGTATAKSHDSRRR